MKSASERSEGWTPRSMSSRARRASLAVPSSAAAGERLNGPNQGDSAGCPGAPHSDVRPAHCRSG
ncbi:MAG: hypothetical protein CFE32_22210 [Alphaproteobacteria bacterium PA3]|nr:MAG: hypothetical protein CFE32_22210 [Alphaproteobacteria bacterium PA3]